MENAFGLMCQYFRVFFTLIATKLETINNIITTCAILHNLMQNDANNVTYAQVADIFVPLVPHRGRPLSGGNETRNKFMNYFVHERLATG